MHVKLNDPSVPGEAPDVSEKALLREHEQHRHRCNARLGLSRAAVDRMVQEFIAAGGGVTLGRPAYAAHSRQYADAASAG